MGKEKLNSCLTGCGRDPTPRAEDTCKGTAFQNGQPVWGEGWTHARRPRTTGAVTRDPALHWPGMPFLSCFLETSLPFSGLISISVTQTHLTKTQLPDQGTPRTMADLAVKGPGQATPSVAGGPQLVALFLNIGKHSDG